MMSFLIILYFGYYFISPYLAFGTFVGGLWMGVILRRHSILSSWRPVLGMALGWGIPCAFYEILLTRFGFFSLAFGVLFGGIVTAFVLRRAKALHTLRAGLGIVFGWLIAYVTGMVVLILLANSSRFFGSIFLDGCAYGSVLGTIAGFIGSTLMLWIVRRQSRAARP